MKDKNLVKINAAFPWLSRLKYVFIGVIIVLFGWWLFNATINKLGLRDDWDSFTEKLSFEKGLELDSPETKLLARSKALIDKKSEKLLKNNFNDFSGLIDGVDSVRAMKDAVINSLYGKKFSSQNSNNFQQSPINNQSSGVHSQSLSFMAILNIEDYRQQRGDTAVYNFQLTPEQKTTPIILVDSLGNQFGWSIDLKNCVRIISKDTNAVMCGPLNYWSSNFVLQGVDYVSRVQLKIFPI